MKPTKFYVDAVRVKVGERAILLVHNPHRSYEDVANTSAVVAYDENTGVIETQNTIYKRSED